MAFIDFTSSLPRYTKSILPQALGARHYVVAALAASLVPVSAALVSHGETVSGWEMAAQNTLRLSFFVFLAAYLARPMARLFPSFGWRPTRADYHKLTLAFAAVFSVSLLCTVAPYYLPMGAPLVSVVPLTTLAFVTAGAFMVIGILVAAQTNIVRTVGAWTYLTLDRLTLVFFWSLFALSAFDHLVGPSRPDWFFGFSLLVLVAGLLVRFADAFAHREMGQA